MNVVWCCRMTGRMNFIRCVKDSMDYRQRPAPTTDAETYEFINELGDKKKQRRSDWSAARHF